MLPGTMCRSVEGGGFSIIIINIIILLILLLIIRIIIIIIILIILIIGLEGGPQASTLPLGHLDRPTPFRRVASEERFHLRCLRTPFRCLCPIRERESGGLGVRPKRFLMF